MGHFKAGSWRSLWDPDTLEAKGLEVGVKKMKMSSEPAMRPSN